MRSGAGGGCLGGGGVGGVGGTEANSEGECQEEENGQA